MRKKIIQLGFLSFLFLIFNLILETNCKAEVSEQIAGLNICGIKVECIDNDYVKLTISAFLPSKDSKSINSLSTIPLEKIKLLVDTIDVGQPKTRKCDDDRRKDIVSLGLIIDCSGSMGERISEKDQQLRMNASKYAINNFINGLKSSDNAFITSFSTFIDLKQDFTSDKILLVNAVNSLFPMNATQFHGAVLNALNRLNTQKDHIKALIVLSDGLNNIFPFWGPTFAHHYSNLLSGAKVYFVALGLGNNQEEMKAKENMRILGLMSGGNCFEVYDSYKLDSVYKALRREIKSENCCEFEFKFKAGKLFQKRNITLAVEYNNQNFIARDYITDICHGWDKFKECEQCIRVRFAIANNDDQYFKYKTELLMNEYEILSHTSPIPIMDLVSYETFATIEEAQNYIEEFKERLRIFNNKFLLMYNPELLINYQEDEKW